METLTINSKLKLCDFLEIHSNKIFSFNNENEIKMNPKTTEVMKEILMAIFSEGKTLIAGKNKFKDINDDGEYIFVNDERNDHPSWFVLKEVSSENKVEISFLDFLNVFSQTPLPEH